MDWSSGSVRLEFRHRFSVRLPKEVSFRISMDVEKLKLFKNLQEKKAFSTLPKERKSGCRALKTKRHSITNLNFDIENNTKKIGQ